MSKALDFSLVLPFNPVTLTDKDGVPKNYVLSGFDGQRRDEWFDFVNERMGEGKTKKFTGVQSKLVSMCLLDSEGKQVPEAEVSKFPAVVLSALFDAAQDINGLSEKAKEEAKNE